MSGELPDGWVTTCLQNLLQSSFYGPRFSSRDYSTDGGVPTVRTTDMDEYGGLSLANAPRVALDPEQLQKFELHEGDLLVTRTGTIGKCALYSTRHGRAIPSAYLIRFRLIQAAVLPKLALLFLQSPRGQELLGTGQTAVTQPNVNARTIGAFEISLPPLDEQRRIVAKVEELLAQVNAAKAHLAKVPGILKRFRQSVLAAACSGKLTEDWRASREMESIEETMARIQVRESKSGRAATDEVIPGKAILSVGLPDKDAPPGWKWLPLTDIAKLESGHTPSRKHPEYWNGKIPWIGILDAGAHHGGVINDTSQTVTRAGLDNSAARLLPARTVCLSRTASVGYVVIMGRPMATSQDFVNWVCSDALVPEFLKYALMAEGSDIKRFGRGSTHTTIYFPEVKALHICLPPVDEQHEIVRRIVALLPVADRISDTVDDATKRTSKLTQAVLTKAFRGELVPTEAELARADGRDYETAEQLLARVRASAAVTIRERSPQGPRKARTKTVRVAAKTKRRA